VTEFTIKDSGERLEYDSGMRRDTTEGKADYSLVYDGPLVDRYAEHLTKGAVKYGPRNWQLADSPAELERFRSSASRHFRQWIRGERDEDHFSATVFNMNAAEYVLEKLTTYDVVDAMAVIPEFGGGPSYAGCGCGTCVCEPEQGSSPPPPKYDELPPEFIMPMGTTVGGERLWRVAGFLLDVTESEGRILLEAGEQPLTFRLPQYGERYVSDTLGAIITCYGDHDPSNSEERLIVGMDDTIVSVPF